MAEQTLTVSELGVIVRAALEAAMPYGVWVEGTIAGLTRSRNGHVYFDLTEPSDTAGEAPVASVPVVLFRDDKARVNKTLTRHGNPIRKDFTQFIPAIRDGMRLAAEMPFSHVL